jgi:hypothetical protein
VSREGNSGDQSKVSAAGSGGISSEQAAREVKGVILDEAEAGASSCPQATTYTEKLVQ